MNFPIRIWEDPRLVYFVAITAVSLLFITIWLFRRAKRSGRQAAVVCLLLSILAHLSLILLVPFIASRNGGSATVNEQTTNDVGVDAVTFSTFDDDMVIADASGSDDQSVVAPLPVSELADLLEPDVEPLTETFSEQPTEAEASPVPESLAESTDDGADETSDSFDEAMSELLDSQIVGSEIPVADAAVPDAAVPDAPASLALEIPKQQNMAIESVASVVSGQVGDLSPMVPARTVATANAPKAMLPGGEQNDFANRVGDAKDVALNQTGGNADTESAVAAALKYLASTQRADGAWDPITSGAGIERAPLGENRRGAGRRAETAITGLSLLALVGAGNTHQQGEYSENVYRGLAYLINKQKSDGSLAGNAAVYASTYSHGMAALVMCEAAAITGDASAVTAARRAVEFTNRMQHPSTGGWRYTPGDPGDLSQLGWQAMVLDAGHRAKIPVDRRSISGVQRFLRSVRGGQHGGLASYRPGESVSRTMTAEALATRLLIGDRVPQAEVEEAQRYILQRPPGSGPDNYYYWYYATLALHQLQDGAWQQWNDALQQRLLATQRADGSWPTSSVWGGYGGKAYTTAMGALCLETYYRHALRSDRDRVANLGNPLR